MAWQDPQRTCCSLCVDWGGRATLHTKISKACLHIGKTWLCRGLLTVFPSRFMALFQLPLACRLCPERPLCASEQAPHTNDKLDGRLPPELVFKSHQVLVRTLVPTGRCIDVTRSGKLPFATTSADSCVLLSTTRHRVHRAPTRGTPVGRAKRAAE